MQILGRRTSIVNKRIGRRRNRWWRSRCRVPVSHLASWHWAPFSTEKPLQDVSVCFVWFRWPSCASNGSFLGRIIWPVYNWCAWWHCWLEPFSSPYSQPSQSKTATSKLSQMCSSKLSDLPWIKLIIVVGLNNRLWGIIITRAAHQMVVIKESNQLAFSPRMPWFASQ